MDDLPKTLGELRSLVSPFRLYSLREQNKTYLNLYRQSKGWMDYARFKAMAYFGAPPLDEAEEAFERGRREYLASILEKESPMDSGTPLSLFLPMVEGAWASEKDPIERMAAANRALISNGLVALRHPIVRISTRVDPGFLLRYELGSPRTPLRMAKRLKQRQAARPADFLPPALEALPVERAFLFGSFAKGERTVESDVDVCLIFEKGLSEREKAGAIASLRKAVEEAAGRRADVREALDCSEKALSETLGEHFELPIEHGPNVNP